MAFVFLGGVSLVVSFVIALYAGGTLVRTTVLLALGAALVLVWLLAIYFSALPTSRPSGCSDCSDHFGRWIDATAVFVVVGSNALAWIIGTAVGSGAKALRKRS